MKRSITSTVIGASFLITFVSILSKGIGFIREIIFANNFGLEFEFNIFLVGAALPIILNTTIIYFGQNFFIPLYNQQKSISEETAQETFNQSLWSFVFMGIIVALLLFILSEFIIDAYLASSSQEAKNLALKIFRIYIFTIPFTSGVSILAAFYQANYLFKYPAFAQVIMNICVVIILFFFSGILGIFVIPIAFTSGAAIQLLFLLINARGKVRMKLAYFQKPTAFFKSFNSRLILTLLVEIITLSYVLIDRYFYPYVDEGGIAALNYANSLYLLPVAIFSTAVATAVFPSFARSISKSENESLTHNLKKVISMNTSFFILVAAAFFMIGDDLISLFYQRGKFSASGTALTYNALKYYSLGLIFYTGYSLFSKVLYSRSMLPPLVGSALFALIIKVTFNLLLVGSFKQNGLAISTAIAFTVLCFSVYFFVVKTINISDKTFYLKIIIFNLVNGMTSFIIAWLLKELILPDAGIYDNLFLLLIFGVVFVANLYLIKSEVIEMFLEIFEKLKPAKREQ